MEFENQKNGQLHQILKIDKVSTSLSERVSVEFGLIRDIKNAQFLLERSETDGSNQIRCNIPLELDSITPSDSTKNNKNSLETSSI